MGWSRNPKRCWTSISPKSFFVFGIRVSTDAASTDWIDPEKVQEYLKDHSVPNMHSIFDFQTWEIDIDFNNPEMVQNTLIELTEAVEKDCPIARKLLGDDFDKELIGEGIVWVGVQTPDLGINLNGAMFKSKGSKHQNSKVKVLVPVDTEKVNNINEFVEYALTENRLKQGLDKLREMGLDADVKNTSEFIRWCVSDSIKENLDTLLESGLTTKDVSGKLANVARQYFMTNLE